jgi:farnesyl diphosphate synthase
MSNFYKKINITAKKTDKYLKKFFLNKNKYNSNLIKPMKYGVFSGGKRFRSSILINTGKIFGVDYNKLIIVGAAIECIHAYSLMHDDLPAMDNDDLRRGKLSVHKKFNEFTAILSGNSLLTLAFEILSSSDLKLNQKNKNELIKSLSVCSGIFGLAEGQYLDLTFEKKKVSQKQIIDMQKKKTGELFGFCCESVAIIANKNIKIRKKLKDIGIDIGLLFQITDDMLDFKGNSDLVGKPTKMDSKKGKATLINLMGYKKTLIFANKLKKQLYKKIKRYGSKSKDLLESVDFLLDREF